jgi:hypothetical protein
MKESEVFRERGSTISGNVELWKTWVVMWISKELGKL